MKKNKTLFALFAISLVCLISIGITDSQAEVIVYDAEGQFLGILLNGITSVADIYVPSMGKSINIRAESGTTASGFILWFESDDCSGTAYIFSGGAYSIGFNGDKLYAGESVAPVSINYNSRLYPDAIMCEPTSGTGEYTGVPAYEITIPFSLPVALPLRLLVEPAHPGKWKE